MADIAGSRDDIASIWADRRERFARRRERIDLDTYERPTGVDANQGGPRSQDSRTGGSGRSSRVYEADRDGEPGRGGQESRFESEPAVTTTGADSADTASTVAPTQANFFSGNIPLLIGGGLLSAGVLFWYQTQN